MPKRIDVLGSRPERRLAFLGNVLSAEDDPELNSIAQAAAVELRAPVGLVSLILDRLQFSRASWGLSGEIAMTRAVDRDLSICQHVVHERVTVEIGDTREDPRVPTEAVERMGMRAYLGEPISVGDVVVGSLCVVDVVPREFTSSDKATLLRYAERANRRLAELWSEGRGAADAGQLLRHATRPVFQDLRNALWQIAMTLDELRIASFEAQRLGTLAGCTITMPDGTPANAQELSNAVRATQDLKSLAEDATSASERVRVGVLALEAAQREAGSADLKEVVLTAIELARHFTKLVGGVDRSGVGDGELDVSPGRAITQVASALSELSLALNRGRNGQGGLVVRSVEAFDSLKLTFACPLPVELVEACQERLRNLFAAGDGARVSLEGDSLCLTFKVTSRPKNE